MNSNPFKIIEPSEKAPEHMKGEVMGSIESVVLMLRFVQLFVSDSTAVALTKLKVDIKNSEKDSNSPDQ